MVLLLLSVLASSALLVAASVEESSTTDECQNRKGGSLMQLHGQVQERIVHLATESGTEGSLGDIVSQYKSKENPQTPNTMSRLLLNEMEALVKSKGKIGLNPEEKHTVYEIEDLMNMDVLPAIFEAHKESLAELQELYDMILACQTTVSTELEVVQDMQTWSTKHADSHKECREEEYVWWSEYKKECTEYEEYKESIKEPEFPPDADGPTDEWIEWLKANDAYYCPLYEVIKIQWEECEESRTNWTKIKEICEETQIEWEEHFCVLRTKVHQVCHSYNDCFDDAVARYNERAAAIKKLMDERIKEFIAATKIECIWEAWEWSEDPCVINETMVETCYEVEPNVTNITVIWPELPDPLPCDVDFVDPYPCEEGWYQKWYDTLDVSHEMLNHMKDNCHACVNTTSEVTTSTETTETRLIQETDLTEKQRASMHA